MDTSASKTGAASPPVPTVQYKFVTDSTLERSEIRRHAMQRVWRDRREQSHQNSSRPVKENSRNLTPKPKGKENEKSKEKKNSSLQRRAASRRNVDDVKQMASDIAVESTQVARTRPNIIIDTEALDIVASPISSTSSGTLSSISSPSPLGCTEVDPFGSLPIRIHREEQEVLHLCEYRVFANMMCCM